MSSNSERIAVEDVEVIKRVEETIQMIRDMELVVIARAGEKTYPNRELRPFEDEVTARISDDFKRQSLSLWLNDSIEEYEGYKNRTDGTRTDSARLCAHWIDLALLSGALKKGTVTLRKLREARAQVTKLKAENRRLDGNLGTVSAELTECIKKQKQFSKKELERAK